MFLLTNYNIVSSESIEMCHLVLVLFAPWWDLSRETCCWSYYVCPVVNGSPTCHRSDHACHSTDSQQTNISSLYLTTPPTSHIKGFNSDWVNQGQALPLVAHLDRVPSPAWDHTWAQKTNETTTKRKWSTEIQQRCMCLILSFYPTMLY